MESKLPETLDLPKLAREQSQIGPAASWIAPSDYDKQFRPNLRGELTHLLQEEQVHAELGQHYVHVARRLESQRTVRSESQWQLYLDPQTQSVVLHSIKIRRDEIETEHLSLDRIQFLQRETGLEGCIIGGQITLLLLLEDVRPGDILEFSYTITTRPRVMPEQLSAFFSLPMGTEIGKFNFLIRHNEKRAVKWKASSPNFTPRITSENGEVSCYWTDTKYASPEPEPCAPMGHLMFPWIQVSDCPDWGTVSRAILSAWEKELPGDALARIVTEITNFSPDPLARVTRAIEMVQDEYRYLSVNIELGGQIPAAPDAVVRRGYGDCKDLAFLMVQLLRALGITARPVLVHTVWTKSVGELLPSLNIFNHAIVEFEIGNEKRWVDGTTKNRGGGALNRYIADFGFGLPIDANTTDLAPVPKASLPTGTYDIKETFMLDTTGRTSCLAVVVTATGAWADAFRNEFANGGIDVMAKDRAQAWANRFTSVTRLKPLECRDDRNANEFVLAEAFEIVTPILTDKARNTCLFQIRGDAIGGFLANPGLAARRHPLGLPFPCHRTQTVELEIAALNAISLPIVQTGNQYFSFSRRCRSWPGRLRVTFSLETLQDSIPPEKLGEHRKSVEAAHEASVLHLELPLGYSRGKPRWDFGALPPPIPTRAENSIVSTQKPIATTGEIKGPITTAEKETVALRKTEEMAGMPKVVKPMPPAREAIPAQTDPQPSRPAQRRPRKLEKCCAIGFYLFLLSVASYLTAMGVARFGNRGLAGLLVLLVVLPSWITSLILAIFGRKQTARYAGRYTDTSKLFSTITLALGGLAGLIIVPIFIYGFCRGIDYARMEARERSAENQPAERSPAISKATENSLPAKPLDFKEQNFTFHPPGSPWEKVDTSAFGLNVIYALWRPDPMSFTIIQQRQRVGVIVMDPIHDMTVASKISMRRTMESSRVTSEKEATYHGMAGWQIETEGLIRGRDTYFVQWIYATNGMGYLLSAWAPRSSKVELEVEANRLFGGFELTPPQQVTALPNP